ncbi:MAG: nuclear transport factor 2 family protein [Solirubrobacteraceae bacterium]
MGNLEILKGGYEAFGRGDVPAVLGIFDSNIEWREAEGNPYKPDGQPWVGGDAILQNLFMKLPAEWDGFTATANEFYDAGDSIAVEGRYSGAFKATGKSMDAQFCHVWKFRDGKVTSFQQYLDTAQWQEAMGTRDAESSAATSVA